MLHDILAAVQAEDSNALRDAAVPTTELSDPAFLRLVAYLDFLLRGRAATVIGHRPDIDELTELSVSLYPEFTKIIRPERARLADILHGAFREKDPGDISLSADHYLIQGSAALAVLLRITGERIEDAHGRVLQWYERTT
jgi:hypothetical protein